MREDRDFMYAYETYLLPDYFNFDQLLETVKIKKNTRVTLQLIDPTWVVSERHISAAVYHTQNAFENKRNLARDKATEFLIRISGQSQIKNALKEFGIRDESKHLLIVTFGGSEEENKEEISCFIKNSKFPLQSIKDAKYPITDIEKLRRYYISDSNIIEIEKSALERIAAIEVR